MTIRGAGKASKQRSVVSQILSYSENADILCLCLATAGSVLQGALMPVMTLVFGTLAGKFTDITSGRISKDEFLQSLATFTLYFVYLAIGELAGSYAMWFGFTLAGENITNRMRRHLLTSLFRKGVPFIDQSDTGEITSLLSSDADSVKDALSSKLGRVLAAFTSVIVAFLIAFSRSWRLTLIMGSGLFAFAAAGGAGAFFISRFTQQSLSAQAEAASIAQESISGITCTMANSAVPLLVKKYSQALAKGKRPGILGRFAGEMMIATITGIATCLFSLAFWRGSRYYINDQASFADVLIVLLAVLLGTASLGLVGPNAQAVAAGLTAARRIFAMEAKPAPINSLSEAGSRPKQVTGDIRFQNVTFSYPTRPDVKVLSDFNLKLPANKTTAIVGASGCGKSTLVRLIQRYFDPSSGYVFLDDHTLPELSLQWLRKNIAVVSQEPDLFNATIHDNIRYGLVRLAEDLSASMIAQKVVDAARKANVHDAIMAMPQGYQTVVGERGARLSGGQRQRIAIARALVSDPKILLLDEATSALDTISENSVKEAVAACGGEKTILIIAHRLSTIRTADLIVVMDRGGIAETGSYDDLIRKKGKFYDLQSEQRLRDISNSHGAALTGLRPPTPATAQSIKTTVSEPTSTTELLPKVREDNADIAGQQQDFDRRASRKDVWVFLLGFTRSTWLLAAFGIIWAVISGSCSTIQAWLFANAVTSFSQGEDKTNHDLLVEVDFWALMLVVLAVVQGIASGIRGSSLAICSEMFMIKAKSSAFEHILRQDMTYFDQQGSAKLTSLLSTTLGQLNSLSVSSIAIFVVGFTGLISAIALSVAVNWKLGLVFAAAVPILLASGYAYGAFASSREQRSRALYSDAMILASEVVDCMGTVVSLSLEQHMDERFWNLITTQARRGARNAHVACAAYALSQAGVYLCFAGCFYYGGRLIASGESSMLDFFICYTAIVTSTPSTGACFNMLPDLRKAFHASRVLLDILSRKPSIDAECQDSQISCASGNVRVTTDNVYFRYPTRDDAQALLGISIDAKPGQYIALVGPSGSGKSTVLSLIQRFYDPQAGLVLQNDIDIRRLRVGEYRQRMALITQETILFSGTIRENIVLASQNVTESDLWAAIRAAALDEFISSLPEGLDTAVGYRGVSLSGGQRQRVAIARGLLGDPAVLLLDEATSALDGTSERLVQGAINDAARGRTSIAVAQRLSTVRHADCIYVIDHGRVVEKGTHDQLITASGVYAGMIRAQESQRPSQG